MKKIAFLIIPLGMSVFFSLPLVAASSRTEVELRVIKEKNILPSNITEVKMKIGQFEWFDEKQKKWGWFSKNSKVFDVLKLPGNTGKLIARKKIDAGRYSKLRFLITKLQLKQNGKIVLANVVNPKLSIDLPHPVEFQESTAVRLLLNLTEAMDFKTPSLDQKISVTLNPSLEVTTVKLEKPIAKSEKVEKLIQEAEPEIYINDKKLTFSQRATLKNLYSGLPPAGSYWYDAPSGLWGVIGRGGAGFIQAGLDLAELKANASQGNTGVFLNGRELPADEWIFFQLVFGVPITPGRYWMDNSKNVGYEGIQFATGNLTAALLQAQAAASSGASTGGGGSYYYHNVAGGTSGGVSGGCVWVNIPGASAMSSGC